MSNPPPTPPPSGPPDTRPPTKPPSKGLHVPDLLAEADAYLTPPAPSNSGHQPPARQISTVAASADGPGFTLPQRKRFQMVDGEHRLVGRVGPPDEAEAEALARIICALHACKP